MNGLPNSWDEYWSELLDYYGPQIIKDYSMEKTTLTTRRGLPKEDGTHVLITDVDGEAELIQFDGYWYRTEDLESGRLQLGTSRDWFKTIYWSDQAWEALRRR